MSAIRQDEQARLEEAPAAAVVPPFAAALRELVDQVDGAFVPQHPHERRLVQRVRAALAAFEAGWTVIGEGETSATHTR